MTDPLGTEYDLIRTEPIGPHSEFGQQAQGGLDIDQTRYAAQGAFLVGQKRGKEQR